MNAKKNKRMPKCILNRICIPKFIRQHSLLPILLFIGNNFLLYRKKSLAQHYFYYALQMKKSLNWSFQKVYSLVVGKCQRRQNQLTVVVPIKEKKNFTLKYVLFITNKSTNTPIIVYDMRIKINNYFNRKCILIYEIQFLL